MHFFKKLDRQNWMGLGWLLRRPWLGNYISETQKFIGENSRNNFIYIFLFFFDIRIKAQFFFHVQHNRTERKNEVIQQIPKNKFHRTKYCRNMNRSWQNQNTTRVILTDQVEAGDHHCIVFIVLAFIKSDLFAKYEITVFVDPPLFESFKTSCITTPKKRQKKFCQRAKNVYDTGFGRIVEIICCTCQLRM